jgi:DNA-binding Lrp family transcriptional regulator
MLEIGFVLIHVQPLHEDDVFNEVSKIPEIVEVYSLFGEYDLIAKIEAKDNTSIGEIVIHKIRKIDGILDTKTLTGINIH